MFLTPLLRHCPRRVWLILDANPKKISQGLTTAGALNNVLAIIGEFRSLCFAVFSNRFAWGKYIFLM